MLKRLRTFTGGLILIAVAAVQVVAVDGGAAAASTMQCPTAKGQTALTKRYLTTDPLRIVSRRLVTFRQDHPAASGARVEAFLADSLCVVRVDKPSPSRDSVNSDMQWNNSQGGIFWDGQHHYVIAHWDWLNNSYKDDYFWSGCLAIFGSCTKNIGGFDGVGLALNTKATIPAPSSTSVDHSYYMATWGNGNNNDWTRSVKWAADTNNAFGVGFSRQDIGYVYCGISCGSWDNNMHHGDILMFFDNYGRTCHDYQAFLKYSHTWSSTSVTGFSITSKSVGITWSTTSNHWQLAGLTGTAHVCR